ncbi:MAG: hypothetical protein WD003_02155 [Candidatus Paceibacterota bacterium]
MSFQKIDEYLKKFTLFTPPHNALKKLLIKIFHEQFGVIIKREDIKICGRDIFITTTPIVKNEVFLHKKDILEEIHTINKKIENII